MQNLRYYEYQEKITVAYFDFVTYEREIRVEMCMIRCHAQESGVEMFVLCCQNKHYHYIYY